VNELYQVQPSEFVRARNALVARLRKAGRTAEAADVARLRRPTPVIWALNRVAHEQPAEVKQLIEATDDLKLAQLGRRKDADTVTTRQRNALGNLAALAAAALQAAGLGAAPATLRRASATLLGAAADPQARALLRQGRLSEELSAPGFEVFGGMTPRQRPPAPAGHQRRARPSDHAAPTGSPTQTGARSATEQRTESLREKRAARVSQRRLQALEREAQRRRRRVEQWERAVRVLRKRAHDIEARLAQERRQAEEAERNAARAREQLTRSGASRG